MNILVIAEHDHQVLKPATLHTLSAANQLGGPVHLLVAGSGCEAVAQAAVGLMGVGKVLLADHPVLAHQLAENLATQIMTVAQAYTHILAPATSFGKNVLPRVAALLDVGQISDVIAIHSPDTFDRPIYAGNVIATVQSDDAIKVMTIRTTAFDIVPTAVQPPAPVEPIATVQDRGRSALLSRQILQSVRPELTSAHMVVAGGRALGSAENFKILEQLADKLGAALGASRAAVDAGYAPNDWQVGQTGKIVAPQVYIAVGISGAIQHLAGMKDSKVIIAINKDPDAPIFGVADFGLVGDLFDIIPKLTQQL